ncbi:MAG: molybdopterin molybdotransferase MoeA [Firmicutes bacterium]|nr:molybdopterin molybdotransferase MoeA [Bacillota bacterium]
MTELFQARTVREARELLAAHLGPEAGAEEASLPEALGRRLARAVAAVDEVPGFARSTVDGFAVRAKDTFGASESMPAYLDLTGEVLMGRESVGQLAPGQAWLIPTGGMLPTGADAVVMVEHTEELDRRTVGVNSPVASGDNVVRAGEDMMPGALLLPRGHLLRPQDLGLLAAAGVTEVFVARRARVGIISSGDEVVEPTRQPGPGQVRDVNSYVLYGQALAAGARPELLGIVGDNFELLLTTLRRALDQCDLVLISGGSSVGVRDVAAEALNTLGAPGVLFHGISIKPGKPTVGAVVNGKPVFGLPGHPVSAAVVFELFVTPLLKYWSYPDRLPEFPVRARLLRNMRSAAGREDFIRVKLAVADGEITAEPILGKSGLISTLVRADGLAYIPAEKEGVEAGELIGVKLF